MKSSRRSFRSQLTYANVTSSLALFLVIAGGAAFAATAAKNSVTSKSIKNGAVKSKDLKDGKAVAGVDVADDSLGGADINEASLALPSTASPTGPAGGALKGSYPYPGLATNAVTADAIAGGAVTAAKLGDDSVTAAKLGDDSVTSATVAANSLTAADIGPSAVGNSELGPIVVRASAIVVVPPGESRNATAFCNAGEVAISAVTRWQSGALTDTDNLVTVHSGVQSAGQDPTGVFGRGRNNTASNKNWQVLAVCLAA